MEPVEEALVRPEQFPPSGADSLAPIGRRFVARLIDIVVLAVPAYLAMAPQIDPDNANDPYDGPLWLYYLVVLVVPVVYEVVFIAWRGQTIGKVTVGVRVARLGDGGIPTWWQAGVRALLPIAVANLPIQPVASLLAIGVYLLALLSPLRQGLHDRAAGTVVLSTR
jgi:uncharacterized RDD family membrane protein YckC